MKLDILDRKIINVLNQNVRAPYSEIAKKVRSSKEVVSYRIKRLIDQDIIKHFVTIFRFGHRPYKILAQFGKIDSQEEKEIVDYIANDPDTNWVTSCSGNWDIIFVIMARDPTHFDQIWRRLSKKIGKFVQDYKISISIGSQTFGHTYVLGSVKEDKDLNLKFNFSEITLDRKDKAIAKILHGDARAKIVDISRKTKIPVDTIKYRIKRMEKANIIKRYRLILNPSKLGYNRYEIFIRCTTINDHLISKFREYAKQNFNIEYFGRCIGSWDIEFTVHLKDNIELKNFVLDVKKDFGGEIKSFETVTLFETRNFIYFPEELR